MRRILGIFILTAGAVSAQLPATVPIDGGNCAAGGIVLDGVTSHGISGATVTITALTPPGSGPYHSSRLTTDDAGRWRLANVACVPVQIGVFKSGFLPGPNGRISTKTSSDGSSDSLRLSLMAQVSVSGTVTDDQGKPVLAAEVVAVSVAAIGGHRVLKEGQRIAVNPNGRFHIGSLDPSVYAICAMSNPDDLRDPRPPWSSYSRSCVPDEHSSDGSLKLEAGQTAHIDFKLHRIEGASIRGRVEGIAEGTATVVRLRRYDESTETIASQDVRTDPRGAFVFNRIPPGDYYLALTMPSSQSATAPVHVESSDIDEIVLRPETPVAVTGRIENRISGNATAVAASTQVELKAPSPLAPQAGPIQWDSAHSSFVFPSLQPGVYKLSVRMRSGYAASAAIGGPDVLDQEVTISGQPDPIEVTIRDDFAIVNGSIADENGKPADGWVYFFRDQRDPISGAAVNGSFVAMLPPGNYRIVAVRSGARAFYADSDWRAKHLPTAQPVALKAGDNAKVSLKVGAE